MSVKAKQERVGGQRARLSPLVMIMPLTMDERNGVATLAAAAKCGGGVMVILFFPSILVLEAKEPPPPPSQHTHVVVVVVRISGGWCIPRG